LWAGYQWTLRAAIESQRKKKAIETGLLKKNALIEEDQIEVGPRLLDTSDFEKLIEDLWFSAGGSRGLPKETKDFISSLDRSD
jgi:hypothetical protein